MEDNELKAILERLDREIPKVRHEIITSEAGGQNECAMVATKNGYLRAGLELMKTAFAAPEGKLVDCDLPEVIHPDSAFAFATFERVDHVEPFKPLPKWKKSLIATVIWAFLFALAVCGLAGLWVIVRSIVTAFR